VKPDEARELIYLVPTKVFADLLLSLVTLRLTERATRTALLELYVLICLRHLRYWLAELAVEREREREKKVGGVVRDTTVWRRV
jgi:hypothetical protein